MASYDSLTNAQAAAASGSRSSGPVLAVSGMLVRYTSSLVVA